MQPATPKREIPPAALTSARRFATPVAGRPPRPLLPSLRVCAALVLGLAVLLGARAATAQTNYVLVSNIGQSHVTSTSMEDFDIAQAFTTGSTAATLSSIDVQFHFGALGTVTAKLATGVSTTSGGTVVANLGSRSSFGTGSQRFTAPANTTLNANTTYFVILEGDNGSASDTSSDSEDAGRQPGWSVGNNGLERSASATGGFTSVNRAFRIRINGSLAGSAAPAAPAPPAVSTTAGTSLTVTWTAPAGAVPAITDYDVEYRRTGDTDWTSHAHTGTALTTTIPGLVQGRSYQARVRATNGAGTGGWSNAGSGHTGAAQVESAETNEAGTALLVTFTKDISGTGTPVNRFSITIMGNTVPNRSPSAISISGRVLTLTLRDKVTTGETVLMQYIKPTSGAKLTDSDGLDIETFTQQPVTNNTVRITVLPPPLDALVSNNGQSSHGVSDFRNDVAQAFTTGGHPGGYRLTRVDLAAQGAANIQYSVSIRSDSSGRPGGVMTNGTLTKPADGFAGDDPFRASGAGIDLDANTTYWVVIDSTAVDTRGTIWGTTGDAEDAGASPGWSIANAAVRRGAASTSSTAWAQHPDGASLKMIMHGEARPVAAQPPDDSGFYPAGGLVSNTGQPQEGMSAYIDTFQAFTTGNNAGGYRVTRVDLLMELTAAATVSSYSVNIRSDSSGSPGGILATLDNPPIVVSNKARVRHGVPGGGIDLEPDTTYWVEYDSAVIGLTGVFATGTSEDAGAAAGWSIADSHGDFNSNGEWQSFADFAMAIAIHGKHAVGPPPVAAPTVSKKDGTELKVTWTTPANAGPASDYDVRYRRKGASGWIEHPHRGPLTTATIKGLLRGASWEAQVRASNSIGTGAWSQAGAGHTGPARLESAVIAANNSGAWRRVRLFFTKVISNGGTRNRYTVTVAGTDRTPNGTTWQWEDGREVRLSLEAAHAVQAGDTVTVSYDKSAAGTKLIDADSLEVASFGPVTVENLVPAAPGKPAAPSVSSVTGQRALTVSWTAPSSDDAPVTDYDLRYFAGSADPSNAADWVEAGETGGHDHVGAATTATVAGLAVSTAYRVQVRAVNAGGAGPWSDSGSASTGTAAPAAPGQPTVAAVTNSRNLTVTWVAPSTGGSAITDYDVRYYAGERRSRGRVGLGGGEPDDREPGHDQHGAHADRLGAEGGDRLPGAGACGQRLGRGAVVGVGLGDHERGDIDDEPGAGALAARQLVGLRDEDRGHHLDPDGL